jgi:hypothetical protein
MTDEVSDQPGGGNPAVRHEREVALPHGSAVATMASIVRRPSNPTRVALAIMGVGAAVAALLLWQATHNEPRPRPGADRVTVTTTVAPTAKATADG